MQILFIRRDDKLHVLNITENVHRYLALHSCMTIPTTHYVDKFPDFKFICDECCDYDDEQEFPHKAICEASILGHGHTAWAGWGPGCYVIRKDEGDFTKDDLKQFTQFWDNRGIKYDIYV